MPKENSGALTTTHHPRTFRDNQYVYVVLSRRAGGISVGINLNPDKVCNFGCVYCQVNRKLPPEETFVALPRLLDELKTTLEGLRPGGLYWQQEEFRHLTPAQQVVRDIAFSGDGEPALFRNFSQVAERCVAIKESLGFGAAKTVLITNATGLERPDICQALAFLDAHHGEIWAKLDAGTPEYFAAVSGSAFPYARVLANILACAQARPVVIQSCFVRMAELAPSATEITAYLGRLKDILAQGGRIKLVQVYSLARPPAEVSVSGLSQTELDAIAARVRDETGLPVAVFL